MAKIQYTVWGSAAEVANGPVLNENIFTITGTTAQSPTVIDPNGGNRSRRVRVFADAAAWVTWGSDPTALSDGTGGRMIGAENPEYFDIPADEKIAAITRS